jgi:hypothetical protein
LQSFAPNLRAFATNGGKASAGVIIAVIMQITKTNASVILIVFTHLLLKEILGASAPGVYY